MKFLHRVNNSTWDIFMDCIYYSRPFLLSPNLTGTATAKKDTVSGWDIDFKLRIRSQLFISVSHGNFGAYTILCNFYRFKTLRKGFWTLMSVNISEMSVSRTSFNKMRPLFESFSPNEMFCYTWLENFCKTRFKDLQYFEFKQALSWAADIYCETFLNFELKWYLKY